MDPDVVINHDQARLLLTAVGRQGEMGQRLVAFFGCMYYSALRPSETVPLTDAAMQLPREGWGEFRLRESTPLSGASWSETGRSRDRRPLKHRPRGDVHGADLVPRSGSEETGRRPVIVVSHDSFNQTPGWRPSIAILEVLRWADSILQAERTAPTRGEHPYANPLSLFR